MMAKTMIIRDEILILRLQHAPDLGTNRFFGTRSGRER
jgi:hypothetical protein